jgi:hypothetical protein
MLNTYNTSPQTFYLEHSNQATGYSMLAGQASRLLEKSLFRGSLGKAWSRLVRRSNKLMDLGELLGKQRVLRQHYAGLRPVLIRQILGTEGRPEDFDAAFHLLNEQTSERWLSVASARLNGAALPAVELIQIGQGYFVRDGHHRISVARALGEETIDAEVTVWEVQGRMPWEPEPALQGCPQLV